MKSEKINPVLSTDEFISAGNQSEELIKKTYYIEKEQIDWINLMSCFEKMDKSEIVRKALDNYIPEKYKKTIK